MYAVINFLFIFFISLGQFWNVPITASQMSGSAYNVTIQPANGAPMRYLQGIYYPITWESTKEPCIYLANSQGGRSGMNPNIDDPLIQGSYKDYQMGSLFDTEYEYGEWESDCTA